MGESRSVVFLPLVGGNIDAKCLQVLKILFGCVLRTDYYPDASWVRLERKRSVALSFCIQLDHS